MTDTPTTDVSDPVRRGLVAYAETVAERDSLRRELDGVKLALSQEQARAAGLEHDLRRAEIRADGACVERDAAMRREAKYETFFQAVDAMMREFRPGEAAVVPSMVAGRVIQAVIGGGAGFDAGDPVIIRDGKVFHAPSALNGSATSAGDTPLDLSTTESAP